MTAAERQQRKRDRQKAGLVLVQAWVPEAIARDVEEMIEARRRIWLEYEAARVEPIDTPRPADE